MNSDTTIHLAVVDDELGIRLGVNAILADLQVDIPELRESVRLRVSAWEDGEGFLENLPQDPPQIVLLDSKLPGIGGMEILEGTLSKKPEIVTIMITAYATLESAVRATKLGAYDFLAKPFTPEELRVTVRKAVNHHVLTEQARRLMEEKRQVRFQFISVLAHELKSPINAVDGYLDLLRNRVLGDSLEPYGDMIERCVTRIGNMRKLINDLLDLTRVESGQRVRTMESVDLAAIAKTAMESQENAAREQEITLVMEPDPDVVLQADRLEMEMICNNLISNAVKYNRPGGSVQVRIQRDEDAILLIVSDTGFGMTQDEVSRLFNDFVRIRNEKTRSIPGSGLGLSLIKKLCTLYRGSVRVESEPDVGSTFTVRLPV